MPRGYWRVVVAAFGFLILANAPPKGYDAASQQEQTSREIADALKGIDASLKQAPKPDVAEQPCERGENRRSSDLCAQWKAADAAARSATAGWIFGTIGTIVGIITMIAAIRAAIYAKHAADAAKDALALDQKSKIRPYLYVDKFDIEERDPHYFRIVIWLRNFGSTPAKHIKSRSMCYFSGDTVDLKEFDEEDKVIDAGVAAPNHSRRTFNGFYLTANDLYRLERRTSFIILRLEYSYAGVEGHATYAESTDYFMDFDGFETRTFYLLTESHKTRVMKRREDMRKMRVERKLWESKRRAEQKAKHQA